MHKRDTPQIAGGSPPWVLNSQAAMIWTMVQTNSERPRGEGRGVHCELARSGEPPVQQSKKSADQRPVVSATSYDLGSNISHYAPASHADPGTVSIGLLDSAAMGPLGAVETQSDLGVCAKPHEVGFREAASAAPAWGSAQGGVRPGRRVHFTIVAKRRTGSDYRPMAPGATYVVVRGAYMMMATPTRHTTAPVTSYRSGRNPSSAMPQAREPATNTPP